MKPLIVCPNWNERFQDCNLFKECPCELAFNFEEFRNYIIDRELDKLADSEIQSSEQKVNKDE